MTIEPRASRPGALTGVPGRARLRDRWAARRNARDEAWAREIDRVEIDNAWRSCCQSQRELNHSVRSASGWTITTPKLVPTGPGRYLVQLLPGQLVRDLTAYSDRLGAALGGRGIRVLGQRPGGWVELAVIGGPDPLADVVDLVVADHGMITLGRDEFGGTITARLADLPHTLVTGATTSGKSSLLRAVVAQAAHDPGVVVAGVDPSLGLWRPLPPVLDRLLGLGDVGALVELVEREVAIMDDRLMTLPRTADRLTPGPGCPLRLIIIDELPGCYRVADQAGRATGERVRGAVSRLLAESHKVGVRLILCAQRGDAKIIGGFERSNLGAMITLRQDRGGLSMLYGSDGLAPDVITEMTTAPAGLGLISAPDVPLRKFRAPWVSYAEYCQLVGE